MTLPAGAADKTILVWGDSISAGLGLDADAGWVHLLEQRLQKQGAGYQVVNASVSGETTAGAAAAGAAPSAGLRSTGMPASNS